MARTETIANASETGASAYAVRIDVSGHSIIGDEPVDFGGGNLGPNPYDLLVAALAECTAMTVRWYAIQHNWPLAHVSVRIVHRKGGPGAQSARQDVFEKCVTIEGPSLDESQRAKLLEVAARCPVQRTLEGTPLITTRCA